MSTSAMQTFGKLYVVGTPIGNLGDLSPRAADIFSQVDTVLCEDTRVTGRLLSHLGISKPLVRCDENVIAGRVPGLLARLQAGEVMAFASDAGMPSVSDPGQVLVSAALDAHMPVEVVPGPSACVTALVASGMTCTHFFFEGFLPRRTGERKRRLSELACVPGALIFYESPHRVVDTLGNIAELFPERTVALCRELTKLHEEVLRDTAGGLLQQLQDRDELRGECVIVVAAPTAEAKTEENHQDLQALLENDIREAIDAGEPISGLSKRLAQKHSVKKRVVYDLAISMR